MFSIIIPVHNHPEFLTACILSVRKKTKRPYKITIVDDGSDEKTHAFLRNLRETLSIDCLLRNDVAMGFSYSCNRGMKAMDADYYCLLNSDTEIGTEGWNEKIIEAGNYSLEVGLIGVLSNSAINQSIPFPGPLLPGYTAETFAALIDDLTEHRHPRSSLVHGFCYIIKKSTILEIGLLDDKNYPHYGSEDDYTFRANHKAGLFGIIMDDVFVYHYNNGSYQSTRQALINDSVPKFHAAWGRENVVAAAEHAFESINYLRKKIIKKLNIEENRYLYVFLAKTETGTNHYIGPDGFPFTPNDFNFFCGTEHEARTEAMERVKKFGKFGLKVLSLEYQKHPVVDTNSQSKLMRAMKYYIRDKLNAKK